MILAAALAVMAAAGLWVKSALDRLGSLEASLGSFTPQTVVVARELREKLLQMNTALFRFQLSEEDSARDAFHSEVGDFARQISQNKTLLPTAPERALLAEMEKSFDQYLRDTGEHLEPSRGGLKRSTAAALARTLAEQSKTLFSQIRQLGELQDQSLKALLADAGADIRAKRTFLLVSLGIFAALTLGLALLTHRAFVQRAQERLEQTSALLRRQEKLASLGVLATGVAHEIRNPLTAIKFRLFSLKKAFGVELSGNEDFQTVHGEVDRLEKIVKNFLQFARPAEPQFAAVDAAELLRGAAALLQPEMEKRKIALALDAPESLPLQADAQQIRQALINLVQNAADSISGAGAITLRARHGAASLFQRSDPVVILEVEDTGQGIPRDAEARLFDPFFSTKEGGTGLGLPIAARIAEKHGGYIQYSTQRNRGATFSVILPKEPKRDEGSNPPDRR